MHRRLLNYLKGHPQQDHETSHGSMIEAKWALHDPDNNGIEVNSRKFGANDDGAPVMVGGWPENEHY